MFKPSNLSHTQCTVCDDIREHCLCPSLGSNMPEPRTSKLAKHSISFTCDYNMSGMCLFSVAH